MLRSLGIVPDDSEFLPSVTIPYASHIWAKSAAKNLGGGPESPLVGLIPASRKTTRRWPAQSYAKLGRMLVEQMHSRIIVFWGPGEEDLAREVCQGIGPAAKASPQTHNLLDLAALISECRLIVTNCNGPKHIAVATGTPTLTIHGSSDPASWNPPANPLYPFIRKEELFCIGCRLNECVYHLECMKDLSPETVGIKAREMLATAGAR
jgi:ADP-heptose:LPS heptosyltransferase